MASQTLRVPPVTNFFPNEAERKQQETERSDSKPRVLFRCSGAAGFLSRSSENTKIDTQVSVSKLSISRASSPLTEE